MNALAKKSILDEHVERVAGLQKDIRFFKDMINRCLREKQRGISGAGQKSLSIEKAIEHLTKLDERLKSSLKIAETEDFEEYMKISDWKDTNERQLAALKASQRKRVNIYEFSYELLDAIKDRTNIVEMLDELKIRKKRSGGGRYVIICPFHDEDTPSCMVYVNEDKFHCFGCQEQGDVVDFYQKYLDLEFDEAVTRLTERLEIQVMDADQVKLADDRIKVYKEALEKTEAVLQEEQINFKREFKQ